MIQSTQYTLVELDPILVGCDGGEYNSKHAVENVLSKGKNVYCAAKQSCSLSFYLAQGCVSEVRVYPPDRAEFTNPVDTVDVQLALGDEQSDGSVFKAVADELDGALVVKFDAPMAAHHVLIRVECCHAKEMDGNVDVERVEFKGPKIDCFPVFCML